MSEISSSNNSGLILDSFFFTVYSQCISKLSLLIYQLLMDSGGLGRFLCWWSACQKHLWVHWEILNQKPNKQKRHRPHTDLWPSHVYAHTTHICEYPTQKHVHTRMYAYIYTHAHTDGGGEKEWYTQNVNTTTEG